jgi:hypothetical protein
MKNWEYTGDANVIEYGGTFVAKEDNGNLEFISIITAEDHKFLFHGVICWPEDYLNEEIIVLAAKEFGYESPKKFLEESPALYANELISMFGCGVFEFSPTNIHGQGEYSMRYEDFEATDDEIRGYLTEAEVSFNE